MLNIISATYGNKDVTDIVAKHVIDDKLSFVVSNNIFGDPIPNVVKYLSVKYEIDGKIKEDKVKENSICDLPFIDMNTYDYNKKIKFIIPAPDSPYYLWQVLVQINNFRKLGYEIDAHYPVCYFNGSPSKLLVALSESINIKSKFHLYSDNRTDKSYSASTKPWLMGQYFKEFPEESKFTYIYLDPDVIFLKPINWHRFTNDDIWYESDTCSYLNSRYIKSKGEQLFVEMCDIVDIPTELVIENDLNCGGAQYVTKNNKFEIWNEIEKVSVTLYNHMINTSEKYKPEKEIYPIQAWTAEMWATNWVLWKHGIKTKCDNNLDFHWANHKNTELKFDIYHNAGVTENDGKYFSKTAYQKSPFNKELKGGIDTISYKYIEEIKDTEMNFPELISIFEK